MTPVAEANFFHDPEAAKIVLDSGVKVTCITLNATMASPFTLAEAGELEALGTASGAFAADLIRIRPRPAGIWAGATARWSRCMTPWPSPIF